MDNLKNEAKNFFQNSGINYDDSGLFSYPDIIKYYGLPDMEGEPDGESLNEMGYDCDVWELSDYIIAAVKRTEHFINSPHFIPEEALSNGFTHEDLLVAVGLDEGF
jgi:hypothetical protein